MPVFLQSEPVSALPMDQRTEQVAPRTGGDTQSQLRARTDRSLGSCTGDRRKGCKEPGRREVAGLETASVPRKVAPPVAAWGLPGSSRLALVEHYLHSAFVLLLPVHLSAAHTNREGHHVCRSLWRTLSLAQKSSLSDHGGGLLLKGQD